MTTDTDLLTLAQWFSPAYPVGAFAYSHGLEAAAEAGWITGASELEPWLRDVLEHGAGRSDALFLAAAYRADASALAEIDAQARAFSSTAERLLETTAQGRAFAQVTETLWPARQSPARPSCYPVAVGASAARAELPLETTSKFYLHAMLSNLVSAAQRLLPLGQTEAQRIIRDLTPLCADIAAQTAHGDLSQLSSAAFLSDIAAMRHETQYSRIFRT